MFDRIDYLTHNKELMGEVYFMHTPVSGYDKPLFIGLFEAHERGANRCFGKTLRN